MSKGVKKAVSVVAAIAIPFVAPAIATSIGLSTAIGSALGSATAGNILGSAITGATLGAAKAALLGEDIRRSALMGGISSGISGYFAPTTSQTQSATASQTAAKAGTSTSTAQQIAGPSNYGLTSNAGLQLPNSNIIDYNYIDFSPTPKGLEYLEATGASTTSVASPSTGATFDYNYVDMSPTPRGLEYLGTTSTPTTSVTFSPTDTATFGTQVAASTTQGVSGSASGSAAGGVSGTAASPTFTEVLAKVPGEIAKKFKDPTVLADLTLRAAGQLAGSALAGDGLTDAERQLLEAQVQELRNLQQTNPELFRIRLEHAMNLIGESKYFDPEYFGLQRARQIQVAGARAKQAGLRGLRGPARQAEERRYDLAISRNVGTAFDVGYNTGLTNRLQTMQAGLNMLPSQYSTTLGYYDNLYNVYNQAENRKRNTIEGIGKLFGSLTGRS